MKVWKKLIAVVLILSVTGCGRGPVSVPESEPEVSAETSEELIEVVIPKTLLDYSGINAEDQAAGFFEYEGNDLRAEGITANADGSLSVLFTEDQIYNEIIRHDEYLRSQLDNANANLVDYVEVNEDYTELIIGVSDYQTFNDAFYVLPVGCICGFLQIFSHPGEDEWHLKIMIINTNTNITGAECVLPGGGFELSCDQFFLNTHDPYYFENEESEA